MSRLIAALLLSLTACALAGDGATPTAREIAEGSPEALGLLAFLNQTSEAVLDDEVGLSSRAAANLMAFRAGADSTLGSSDDREFQSVAEVDAVPQVGPVTLETLVDFAIAHGWVQGPDDYFGTFDGVDFTLAQAEATLALAGSASMEVLDDEVALDSRAASSIVAARPIADLEELAGLSYVGASALRALRDFTPAAAEIGIISDLDKTVIPPGPGGGVLPDAPYPGVASLYRELEFRNGGAAGDMHYVTARSPDAVLEIPAWLDANGVPTGSIDTGTSGVPWVARPEKVADITALFEASSGQTFVLIGDTNHVDPDVFHDVMELYPDRIIAAFVHNVKSIGADRTKGLHLFDHHGEVAAILFELGELSEDAARRVLVDAQAEGLSISDAEIQLLLEDHRP
jgi:hypothetical protein